MSLDFWSPGRVDDLRPDEDVFCTSRLYLPNGSGYYAGASVGCIYDAAHERAVGDKRHCHDDARWTDAMAAESLAERLAEVATASGPMCDACDIRPAAGLCRPCFTAQERDENRETETESEDAA